MAQKNDRTYNAEVVKTLQEITKDKESLNKAKRKIKFAMICMIILNCVAGILIGSIYYWLPSIEFLIIGGLLVLLGIPVFIVFNKAIKRLQQAEKLIS